MRWACKADAAPPRSTKAELGGSCRVKRLCQEAAGRGGGGRGLQRTEWEREVLLRREREKRGAVQDMSVGGGKVLNKGTERQMGREHGLGWCMSSALAHASRPAHREPGSCPAPTPKRAPPRPHPDHPEAPLAAANPPAMAPFAHVLVLVLLAAPRAIFRRLNRAIWAATQLFTPKRARDKFYFPGVGVRRRPQAGRGTTPLMSTADQTPPSASRRRPLGALVADLTSTSMHHPAFSWLTILHCGLVLHRTSRPWLRWMTCFRVRAHVGPASPRHNAQRRRQAGCSQVPR